MVPSGCNDRRNEDGKKLARILFILLETGPRRKVVEDPRPEALPRHLSTSY